MPESHQDLIASLNERAKTLLDNVREDFSSLGIETQTLSNGAELLNFGSEHATSTAGDLLAKICMADLASSSTKTIAPSSESDWEQWTEVTTEHPLIACMASQYAGWPLSVGDYFAMCSGPARSARGKEKVLDEYKLSSASGNVVAVLETGKLPDEVVAEAIATECDVAPDQVQLCVAPTSSLAGTIQIVARSVETAIHKLHELEFDLSCIRNGKGIAPVPPKAKDDLVALGWTNDSVLYGASVELTVDCEDEVLAEIGPTVPSSSSSDFGTPFLETFKRFNRDFYKIDKMLFSPARIAFVNSRTQTKFEFGEQRFDILNQSWKASSDD